MQAATTGGLNPADEENQPKEGNDSVMTETDRSLGHGE